MESAPCLKRPASTLLNAIADSKINTRKRRLSKTDVEHVAGYKPLDYFCYYVEQVSRKHTSGDKIHPYVKAHGFPPAGISEELNLKWVQQYLRGKIADGDRALEIILMGAFQAPDQPFCFKEILPNFMRGIR